MKFTGSNRFSSWLCSASVLGVVACGASPDVVGSMTTSKGATSSANAERSASKPAAVSTAQEQFVVQTSTFTVDPGAEVYKCQDFANPFAGKSVGVVATEMFLTAGSHHAF